MIEKQSPALLHDSPPSSQPVTPDRSRTPLSHEIHDVTNSASSHSRAAQVLFWRLPYRLRQRVFRQLRPALAAHYDRMLHGQAGAYSLVPMLERGCLFVHIPKRAGVAMSHALFGLFDTANHRLTYTTPPHLSVHSLRAT